MTEYRVYLKDYVWGAVVYLRMGKLYEVTDNFITDEDGDPINATVSPYKMVIKYIPSEEVDND